MIWIGLIIGLMIGGVAGFLLAALMKADSYFQEDDE